MKEKKRFQKAAESMARGLLLQAERMNVLAPGENTVITIHLKKKPIVEISAKEGLQNLLKSLPPSKNPSNLRLNELPMRHNRKLERYFLYGKHGGVPLKDVTLRRAAKMTYKELSLVRGLGLGAIHELLTVLRHYKIPSACKPPRKVLRELRKLS